MITSEQIENFLALLTNEKYQMDSEINPTIFFNAFLQAFGKNITVDEILSMELGINLVNPNLNTFDALGCLEIALNIDFNLLQEMEKKERYSKAQSEGLSFLQGITAEDMNPINYSSSESIEKLSPIVMGELLKLAKDAFVELTFKINDEQTQQKTLNKFLTKFFDVSEYYGYTIEKLINMIKKRIEDVDIQNFVTQKQADIEKYTTEQKNTPKSQQIEKLISAAKDFHESTMKQREKEHFLHIFKKIFIGTKDLTGFSDARLIALLAPKPSEYRDFLMSNLNINNPFFTEPGNDTPSETPLSYVTAQVSSLCALSNEETERQGIKNLCKPIAENLMERIAPEEYNSILNNAKNELLMRNDGYTVKIILDTIEHWCKAMQHESAAKKPRRDEVGSHQKTLLDSKGENSRNEH